MGYSELVVKPEMEQQQAQDDGFVPPPSTSFMESLWLLVDWLQGRSLQVQRREDSKTTTNTMIQNESHAPHSNPHLQQIQELKQQLLALELELQGHGAPSNNPIAMEQHRKKVSPMNQRFQDRLRAQQEQDQQLPPPTQQERDMDVETRASESQSLAGKDRAQSTFSLAAIWASTVEGTKSMITQAKEMLMETHKGVDQDRNQQQSQEHLQQRSDSDSESESES